MWAQALRVKKFFQPAQEANYRKKHQSFVPTQSENVPIQHCPWLMLMVK